MSIKTKLVLIIVLLGIMLFVITGFMLWTQLGAREIVSISGTAALTQITEKWKQGVEILAILSLLILLVSYPLISTIIRSIDVLKKGAEIIGQGKFDTRIDLDSKNELGQLAASFNRMTENLQKTTISRDYVDNIVRSMHGSLIVTSPERYIQTVNSATCDLLGYSEKELHAMPLENLFADESAALQKSFNELIQKGFVRYVEASYKTKDGRRVPVLFSASVMKGPEGDKQGIVLVSVDITERKNAELKQAKLLHELDSVNQELKDFAYIVSHDLKAPLRGITSLASWIKEDYKDRLDKEGCDQLDLLANRVNRMQALINGILHYSRVGRVREEMEKVDLNKTVNEIIDSLSPPPHIVVSIDDPLPVVMCEPTRIRQLFQNLISNAVKYMDKEQGFVRIGCMDKGNHWQFSISDNGPGIEDKYFKKIFQIFQTLHPRDQVESTGIGLAVVKKIVEMNRGRIWLESETGKGSTFFFTIKKNADVEIEGKA